MPKFLLLLISILSLGSCNDVDDDVLPVIGIYRAHVFGVAGPFDLITSTDSNDEFKIEALFDGLEYYIACAEISDINEHSINIEIDKQDISSYITISGKGFYVDGTLELTYSLKEDGTWRDFKIVGTKL